MPSEDSDETAQADLNLRWAHMSIGSFSDVVSHVSVGLCYLLQLQMGDRVVRRCRVVYLTSSGVQHIS